MTRTLATLSLILALGFVLAVLALHLLSPEIDPARSGISYYALGNFGVLLGLGFASVGLAGLALALALWPAISSAAGRIGLVLLALWGVSALLAGVFPIDAPDVAGTTSGRIHNLLGMNFLVLVPALLLLEVNSSHTPTRGPRRSTRLLAWVLLVAALLLFVFNGPLFSLKIGGTVQRVYWLVVALWLVLKAAQTRRVSRRATA